MSSINAGINEKIRDFNGSIQFIEEWIEYLKMTPWADDETLFGNLRFENAVSWPFYCIHYETDMSDGFRVKSHTLWDEDNRVPGIDYLKRVSEIFEINFEVLCEEIMKKSNSFHERFYDGHREEDSAKPPMHQIFQRLMNDVLTVAYETEISEGRRNSKGVDMAITICLRIDNLFSNKPIEINFENYVQANETFVLQLGHLSFHQLGVTFVQDETGALFRSIDGLRSRLRTLEQWAKKKLCLRYKNQRDRKKKDIIYDETEADEYSSKWLNNMIYPTNSQKIDL